MYTALEIARYIINKCIELGRPVSNLQLQKILYYVQGEYIKATNGKKLFSDDICAWQYGPVVPDVYYNYNIYSASEITDNQTKVKLSNDITSIIDPVIDYRSKFSAWELVEQTHSESPWIDSFNKSNGCVINKSQMEKQFCDR